MALVSYALNGELSFQTVPKVWQDLSKRLDGDGLQLDMRDVGRVDSAGLAMLVTLIADAQSAHRTIKFVEVPAQLRQLAKVSGVDALLMGEAQ